MIASLMMYARPELEVALSHYWAQVRSDLAEHGIDAPEHLSNAAEVFSVWEAPDLVLSQTCGRPYAVRLSDKVQLVGTPDFGIEGCAPGYYRSMIVVRANDARTMLAAFASARFAYNEILSQSGFAAPYALAQQAGFWFQDRVASGGHAASALAVAEGRADIAALDAMTWRLLQRYDDFTRDLRVLCMTDPTPGLPYITRAGADAAAIASAVRQAIAALNTDDREALGLRALIDIPKSRYLEVPQPPATAL